MDSSKWLNFPKDKPKSDRSYLVQLWHGQVTVARWGGTRWTLYRPGAVLRFCHFDEPAEPTPEEKWERDEILSEHEDVEMKIMGLR